MAVVDPFHNLIQGVLQGHELAMAMKNQAMHEEAFQRAKANEDRENQLRDIQAQMQLSAAGRPVTGGNIDQSFQADMPSAVPGVPGSSQTVRFSRPADKNRLLNYRTSDGRMIQTEAYTPDELYKQQTDRLMQSKAAEAFAGRNALDMIRGADGIAVPADLQDLYPAGYKLLPEEIAPAREKQAAARNAGIKTLAPGATMVDTSAPGGAKVVAQAAPLEDPKTRAARSYQAALLGKKPEDLTPKELVEGVQRWETDTMNPLDKELKQAELKAKPFDLAAKQSTLASQALERQIKGQELDLAGDPDTINMAAQKFLQTGQMPALGMGSSLLRGKIMGRASELAKENGLSPEQVPALQDSYKSLSKSLDDLQKRKGQLVSFEEGAAKNLDNFIALAQKQSDTGSPLFNRVVRGGARSITGSPDQAAADAARVTAFTEISKVLSGSLGSGVLSDSARKESESILSGDYSMKQLLNVAKVLRQDMKNRSTAIEDQITTTRKQMQGLTAPKKEESPAASSAETAKATHRYNLATGKIEEIK